MQNILNKLHKFTSAQEPIKVEFALELGGIKKMASQLKSEIKAYNQKFSTIDDLVRELNNEAEALDKRAENFFAQVKELEIEGRAKAKELGIDFIDTPIGKEWDSIARSILSGELETIKQGLKIKF
jgi:septation ring formation regulator EzrA